MRFQFAIPLATVLSIAATAQTPSTETAPNVKVVEEIAAKVNFEIVTRGQLEDRYKDIEAQAPSTGLRGQQLQDFVKEAKSNALRDEIDQMLLVQKGKEMPGLSVDAEVTKFFNAMQSQLHMPDEEKFHAALLQQYGETYEELRERKKRDIISQRVVGYEVASKINVPEADMQKYYEAHKSEYMREEEVFLSQILISTEGKSPAQVAAAEETAKQLVERARKGEKFSELARNNSDDPDTAQAGGYLGSPSKRGSLRPEIEAKVWGQKKGYVTDPIKLTNPPAILILKVEEHHDAGLATFDEVREEIQNAVVEPQMGPKVREYLTRLRTEAFLQIKDGYVDSGAAPGQDTRWKDVAVLKPVQTTKEEVLSRSKPHKKVLGVPIPGTEAPVKTAEETERPPKPSKHHSDVTPEALETGQAAKAAKEDTSPPMAPIKQ